MEEWKNSGGVSQNLENYVTHPIGQMHKSFIVKGWTLALRNMGYRLMSHDNWDKGEHSGEMKSGN